MEFKAVSMPCTEAQWEEIKPVLERFGIQNEDITDFETDRFLVNNYMSVNNLVTNIPPSEIVKHGRMFFPTYNKEAFLKACGVDYKLALEPKVAEKKRRIQDLKPYSLDKVFQLSKEQIHALNNGTTTVKELFPDLFTKESKPADMEKVKALFKTEIENRYKAGMWIKQQWNENHVCKLADEPLCFDIFSCLQYAFLGNVCVFYKGQFAEIPTISKQEAENQLKINIE